jgi:hypothetical protein
MKNQLRKGFIVLSCCIHFAFMCALCGPCRSCWWCEIVVQDYCTNMYLAVTDSFKILTVVPVPENEKYLVEYSRFQIWSRVTVREYGVECGVWTVECGLWTVDSPQDRYLYLYWSIVVYQHIAVAVVQMAAVSGTEGTCNNEPMYVVLAHDDSTSISLSIGRSRTDVATETSRFPVPELICVYCSDNNQLHRKIPNPSNQQHHCRCRRKL